MDRRCPQRLTQFTSYCYYPASRGRSHSCPYLETAPRLAFQIDWPGPQRQRNGCGDGRTRPLLRTSRNGIALSGNLPIHGVAALEETVEWDERDVLLLAAGAEGERLIRRLDP